MENNQDKIDLFAELLNDDIEEEKPQQPVETNEEAKTLEKPEYLEN